MWARRWRLITIRRHAWLGMQSRPRAIHLSPSRPLSFCSMCHEQLSLSHRPGLQSLTSVVVAEMLHRSQTYQGLLISSRLVLDRGLKNCLRATSWRTRSHCCLCSRSTSEQTANFFWTAAVVAVDWLPRSVMLQFSFVFTPITSCPWFRLLS